MLKTEIIAIFVFSFSLLNPSVALSNTVDELILKGQSAYQQGHYTEALLQWDNAATQQGTEQSNEKRSNALLYASQACQAQGQPRLAISRLQQALSFDNQSSQQKLQLLNQLSQSYLQQNNLKKSRHYMQQAREQLKSVSNLRIRAEVLNNQANLNYASGEYEQARQHYQQSQQFAQQGNYRLLALKIAINLVRTQLKQKKYFLAQQKITLLFKGLKEQPDNAEKLALLLNLGHLYTEDSTNKTLYGQILITATTLAENLKDHRSRSYALGYAGRLLEKTQHLNRALEYYREAAFSAQLAQAPESLYRWQWLMGDLLKQQGKTMQALIAYKQAIQTLQPIRRLLNETQDFETFIKPVYYQYVDSLLNAASTNEINSQDYLKTVLKTLEQLKTAELEDYFQSPCRVEQKTTKQRAIAPQTAILYPVILSDRLEILLKISDKIMAFNVPVNRQQLTEKINELRFLIVKRTTRQYLHSAQALYQWLILPIKTTLQQHNIDTLVYIPDGALRTIPLSVLHDGKQFLLQHYAIATTPNLTLTVRQPMPRQNIHILANILTESVQGFSSLPNVNVELMALKKYYNVKTLKDQQFLLKNIETELKYKPYNIVHIASHGQFDQDPDNTFLLTYDSKLTLHKLEQYIGYSRYKKTPVELLTLSACQTAAGDDRAALGLAGVAVRAGAKSALATLWYIDDKASSMVISEFYRLLKDPRLSKVVVLQKAQQQLLAKHKYKHPGYWAPFLMIGNWL